MYFKNGKTSAILVWVSQERWWRINTLLSFYRTFTTFFIILIYYLSVDLACSVCASEISYLRFSARPRLAALARSVLGTSVRYFTSKDLTLGHQLNSNYYACVLKAAIEFGKYSYFSRECYFRSLSVVQTCISTFANLTTLRAFKLGIIFNFFKPRVE